METTRRMRNDPPAVYPIDAKAKIRFPYQKKFTETSAIAFLGSEEMIIAIPPSMRGDMTLGQFVEISVDWPVLYGGMFPISFVASGVVKPCGVREQARVVFTRRRFDIHSAPIPRTTPLVLH